jgi:hypothetical protein
MPIYLGAARATKSMIPFEIFLLEKGLKVYWKRRRVSAPGLLRVFLVLACGDLLHGFDMIFFSGKV